MQKYLKLVALILSLPCCFFASSLAKAGGNVTDFTQHVLKTSWEPWYPYQYLNNKSETSSLTGLDIQLVEVLAHSAQQVIEFEPMAFSEALLALKNGDLDFISGATYSKDREAYGIYSEPYRLEEDALFILRSESNSYSFDTVAEFQEYMKKNKFRLGVTRGVIYTDASMNAFIHDPANKKLIVYANNDEENLQKLVQKEIDGFLADRLVGCSLVFNAKKGKIVVDKELEMKSSIHLIFSRKTVNPTIVSTFNKSIENLKQKEIYEDIIAWYLYPAILLETVDSTWFRSLDILGTVFFSISGVLIANSLNGTLLSALIYAILASIGGGLLRDVLFGQRPVDALVTPLYLMIVCATVLIGFIVARYLERVDTNTKTSHHYKRAVKHFKLLLTICDALGLAAFTVTGVMISLMAKVEPLWLWGPFFAFLTGAAGTIVRDILSKRRKIEDIEGEIYSEVAIIWGFLLSVVLLINSYNIHPELVQNYVLVTVVGAFLTRMFIYFLKVPNVYFK